jgi:hypothetical protein
MSAMCVWARLNQQQAHDSLLMRVLVHRCCLPINDRGVDGGEEALAAHTESLAHR